MSLTRQVSRLLFVLMAAGGLLIVAAAAHADDAGADQPGDYLSGSLNYDGLTRTFHYYLPTSYDGSEPLPVVLDFHGYFSSGHGQRNNSRFDRVAEAEGFIAVFPDGTPVPDDMRNPAFDGAQYHWYSTGADDVGFVEALIDNLDRELNIDTSRVYAAGMSNGGGMALKLGLELTDRIAAVAVVSSGSHRALMTEHIEAGRGLSRPFSFILSVGTADDGAYGPHEDRVGVDDVIAYFIAAIGADEEAEVTHWPATDDDETSIRRYVHGNGARGTEVVLYQVAGGGHTWPGGPQYLPADRIGPVSTHLDQSAEIWRHFERQSLHGELGP